MNCLRLLKKQGVDVSSAHLYLNKYDPDLSFIESWMFIHMHQLGYYLNKYDKWINI